jgi:hypothetical protein
MKRKAIRRAKPARGRAGAKKKPLKSKTRRANRTPVAAAPPDAIDVLVAANAKVLGLSIDPAWQPGVTFNLRLILRLAALIDEFPLPDDAEPAPVFHA